ncbi:hypothetical protein CB1_000261027 [Camelus ferus]|nr:hypothetical protein CB1_000261027 [Camelus ferus]
MAKNIRMKISSIVEPLATEASGFQENLANHKTLEPVTKELLDLDQAEVKRLNFSPGTQSYPFVSKWSLHVMEIAPFTVGTPQVSPPMIPYLFVVVSHILVLFCILFGAQRSVIPREGTKRTLGYAHPCARCLRHSLACSSPTEAAVSFPDYKGSVWGKPSSPLCCHPEARIKTILNPKQEMPLPPKPRHLRLIADPKLGPKRSGFPLYHCPLPNPTEKGRLPGLLVRGQTQGTCSKEQSMGDTSGRGAKGMGALLLWQGHGGLGASHRAAQTLPLAVQLPQNHCLSGLQ